MEIKNIFENIPDKLNDELLELLAEGKNVRIERIVSQGQTTPENSWYDQNENEFVLLLKGEAKLLFENNSEITLKAGDYLTIPAHVKHRVSYTSVSEKCVWLTVFF